MIKYFYSMKQVGFIVILGIYLAGCIEHRPSDTTFVREPKKSDKSDEKKEFKGLRVYTGTIPCADCPGIEQRLALKGDSSGIYRLTEVYKEATEDGDEVLVSTGEWKRMITPAADGKKLIYYLSQTSIRDSARVIRYLVYDKKIVQLDMDGEPVENPALYTLGLVNRIN